MSFDRRVKKRHSKSKHAPFIHPILATKRRSSYDQEQRFIKSLIPSSTGTVSSFSSRGPFGGSYLAGFRHAFFRFYWRFPNIWCEVPSSAIRQLFLLITVEPPVSESTQFLFAGLRYGRSPPVTIAIVCLFTNGVTNARSATTVPWIPQEPRRSLTNLHCALQFAPSPNPRAR
jgi:hypothetical protein